MADPTKKGPPASHTRSRANPRPAQEHTGEAPQHRAARPNAPSASGRGMSGARAAKAGKMDKGVPVEVTGDTPLPVKEIVHENPHASGGSELSSRSPNGWTSSRRAKARETAARVERRNTAFMVGLQTEGDH